MTESNLKLLSASEAIPMPTGYSVVMGNLLPRLERLGWDCYHIGWQYHMGPQRFSDINGHGYTQLRGGLIGMDYEGFPEYFPRWINEYKPDVCLSLIDFWFTFGMIQYAKNLKTPYVNYFPVDGEPFYFPWIEELKKCQTPLAMSKYGKNVIEESVRKYGQGAWTRHFDVDYLYHGVDTNIFKPLDETRKRENRQNKFAKNPDVFVLGVVGKNCDRKQHTRVLEAFEIFQRDKDDVVLMMKVGDPIDRTGQGRNLEHVAYQLGLKHGEVIFIDNYQDLADGISAQQLSAYYNLFDVYISGSSGEGFGIPTIEAMACGTPCILPDYTTSRELIEDKGWLVPNATHYTGEYLIKRGIVDINSMVEAMNDAYENPKKVRQLGNKSFRFARKFGWDDIAKKLDGILKKSIEVGV